MDTTAVTTVAESLSVMDFILANLGELIIGLLAFIKIIVNITPTEKDNKVFRKIDLIINMLVSDRKKSEE